MENIEAQPVFTALAPHLQVSGAKKKKKKVEKKKKLHEPAQAATSSNVTWSLIHQGSKQGKMSTMEVSAEKVAEKSTKPLGMRKNGMRCPALGVTIAVVPC